jgi:hypothetical protein
MTRETKARITMRLQDVRYIEWLAADRGWKVGDALFYARYPRDPSAQETRGSAIDTLCLVEGNRDNSCRRNNVVPFPRRTARG